ncbi:MAG: response regulator transcription factor [Aquificaceae bacterium]|nr:response regulator transcription factor [Aquificaceae bacterium]MCX8164534.1 response regulator transcription factor [Aquificaceae bacterium]
MKILLVEDDVSLAHSLKELLEEEGFKVSVVMDGKRAISKTMSEEFDLIILDHLLPTLEGPEVLKRLRREGIKTPVIMLTVISDVNQKVRTLSEGADDYVTKPFDFRELLARIHSVLRRLRGVGSSRIEVKGVTLELDEKRVFCDGKEVKLTHGEYLILRYLFLNRGMFVSREELMERALNSLEVNSNVVDVLISRIRKKLCKDVIESKRRFGYRVS